MKLTDVRLSFPKLFKAEEFKTGDGKFRRSAAFHVEKGTAVDKMIEAEIASKTLEAFDGNKAKADKWIKEVRGQKNQDCYRPYPEDDKIMVLASHRSAKDGPVGVFDNVIDPETKKVRVLGENEGRPYGGCYVNATVELYIQNKGENQGVRCGLTAVQFARNGDAFGGAKPANPDDFAPVEGADAEAMA